MAVLSLTAGGLALLAGILASGAATADQARAVAKRDANTRNSAIKSWLYQNYPNLTENQISALIDQYGDTLPSNAFDFKNFGDQSDWSGLQKLMEDVQNAYAKYGDMPDMPSPEELNRVQQQAYDEIDTENQNILNLYNQSFSNTRNMLEDSLRENTQMFGDYRNQLLTNEAMRQQAIAGSTRFELDRQQRNAIVRGASAAQRLVANINTQLGLQAQSAQQSLDTSNALAQNLLAHRQAQQGIRNQYLESQNQHNMNMAGLMQGQAERRNAYGQSRKQEAINDANYATDRWNENVSNSGLGTLGEGIYRNMYGNKNRNAI